MLKRWIVPVAMLLVFLLVFIFIGLFFSTPSMRLTLEQPTSLNDDWVHVINQETQVDLDVLPVHLDIANDDSYTIETVLGDDFKQSQYMLIRTSLSNVRVVLDGVLVYVVDFDDEIGYASTWHVVEIPSESEGKMLSLTFDTPYESMRGIINEIEYGSTNALYTNILRDYGFRFVMGALLLMVGLIIYITSLFMFDKQNRSNVYLGLFAVLVSVWLLAESRVLQFFIGNTNVLKSLSYISLSFLPVQIAIYLRKTFVKDHQLIFKIITWYFAVHVVVITVLHFTQVMRFFETVVSTIVSILIVSVLALGILIKEYVRYKETKLLKVIGLMVGMMVFIGVEVAFFSISDFRRTADFASFALSILLLLVFVLFIRFVFINYWGNLERQLYEKIATTDQLTKAYSRYAFFHAIETYREHEQETSISIIYFDLDGLKIINDQFGHATGDEAIIRAYEIIQTIYGHVGDVYRMGGDEFVCLVQNLDQTMFETLNRSFETLALKVERETRYSFNVAIGLAHFDSSLDKSLTDTLKRADASMYKQKKAGKKISSLLKKNRESNA